MIPGKQYTPELVLQMAWRRKWLIVLPAVVIAALACGVTYTLPDEYRSETLILVVPQRVPESYVRSTITTRIEDRLHSINQQVRSRTRLERIIEEFNLYPERRQTQVMQDIVDDMSRKIDVQIVQGDAFRVAFTSDHPRTAQQVTERLASFFIDESLRDREVLAEGTSRFLESQLEEARLQLIENEQKLAEYRRQHDGELPTQVDANLQGLHNAEMQLQVLRGTIERDRDRQLVLQRMVADLSTSDEPASAGARVAGGGGTAPEGSFAHQLAEAEAMLRSMLLQKTPDHPDVSALQRQIATLKVQASEEAAGVTPLGPAPRGESPAEAARRTRLEDAQIELARVERAIDVNTAEQGRLLGVIGEYQRRMEAAPARDSELMELLRDYTTLQATYNSLLAKKLESQISANLERRQIGEQFKILDPARLPERPSSPDRPRFYALGVLLALGVGLACAGLAEYLDRGLRSEEDVRLALGLPVLATIPLMTPDAPRGRRKAAASTAAVMLAAAAALWGGVG